MFQLIEINYVEEMQTILIDKPSEETDLSDDPSEHRADVSRLWGCTEESSHHDQLLLVSEPFECASGGDGHQAGLAESRLTVQH